MAQTFKILSALLSYPSAEIQSAAEEFLPILANEGLLSPDDLTAINLLIEELQSRDLLDLQERYVMLFDRTRTLSLHLFEHVHGESRDRGQAMVDLKAMYEERGLDISSTELPDYVPLFLEFLSVLEDDEAIDLLSQPAHVIAALGERLATRESSYAAALTALAGIAEPADATATQAILAEPEDDPEDLEALDAIWEAEAVTFGPGSPDDGCPKVAGMMEALAEETLADDGVASKPGEASNA